MVKSERCASVRSREMSVKSLGELVFFHRYTRDSAQHHEGFVT